MSFFVSLFHIIIILINLRCSLVVKLALRTSHRIVTPITTAGYFYVNQFRDTANNGPQSVIGKIGKRLETGENATACFETAINAGKREKHYVVLHSLEAGQLY